MAQTKKPSNTQSTFSTDATNKQHNAITKLQKHPREQICNKLCVAYELPLAKGVSASFPSPFHSWLQRGTHQPYIHNLIKFWMLNNNTKENC